MAPFRDAKRFNIIPHSPGREPCTQQEQAESDALSAYVLGLSGVHLAHTPIRAHPYALFDLRFEMDRPADIRAEPFRWLWCQISFDGGLRVLARPAAWLARERTLILTPRTNGILAVHTAKLLATYDEQPDTVKLSVLYRGVHRTFRLLLLH